LFFQTVNLNNSSSLLLRILKSSGPAYFRRLLETPSGTKFRPQNWRRSGRNIRKQFGIDSLLDEIIQTRGWLKIFSVRFRRRRLKILQYPSGKPMKSNKTSAAMAILAKPIAAALASAAGMMLSTEFYELLATRDPEWPKPPALPFQ
jgi:hypothetical protein